MSRFYAYNPEQAYLLPPNVKDVLGAEHLCFHIHRVVERLQLQVFEQAYAAEGRLAYPPAMMLKVWLYAFALGVTSTRRVEQRVREDLAFRYLAGGLTPDHKTLSEFLRRHRRAINDVFTQVLELAQAAGMARLGHVAIDSTRVRANAARASVEREQAERDQRARRRRQVRTFQQKATQPDPDENAGLSVAGEEGTRLAEQLGGAGVGLRRLPKAARRPRSRTDPDSRFLRGREGWVLGYTGEVAVSEDHFIVAQRVTQAASDNASLLPMVDEVERNCRARPQQVSADAAYFSGHAVRQLAARHIDAYVPDANLTHELHSGQRARGLGRSPIRDPAHRRLRAKLRSPAGRATYRRRQALVEPVLGVLKEQRGLRRFRRRGLDAVAVEWCLAAIAFNLTRMARA